MTAARRASALPAAIAVIVALDLATKAWARAALRPEPHPRALIGSVLQLAYRENTGVVFGLLSSAGARPSHRAALLALGSVGVVALAALLVRVVRAGASPLLVWAIALGLAGAIGNLVDRAARGYVVDFIVLEYHGARWPTFNVADMAISAAIGLGVVMAARGRRA